MITVPGSCKVFGIGMPKTGTSSLNAALEILGYRACHFPHDSTTVSEIRAANFQLSILDTYDALTDVPIPAIYPQLDAAWPSSKFILTVRELESWLTSSRNADFNQVDAIPGRGSVREYYRELLYGCSVFSEELFARAFEAHHNKALDYFSREKKSQLLVMDIAGGEGWEVLCPFLGKSIPDCRFPHVIPKQIISNKSGRSGVIRLVGVRRLLQAAVRKLTKPQRPPR